MIIIEKAIPCILHLENRTSEAMIFHLIRYGLQLWENERQAAHALRCAIETKPNEVIFGEPTCKSNWRFPLQDDGSMGPIKFSNWRARRVVQQISNIVDLCITVEVERDRWKEVFSSYTATIQVRL
jgi:hypothetical protein